MRKPCRLLVVSPTLADGGSDRVALTLLRHLDRTKFAPKLALMRADGALVRMLPRDVVVHVREARRLALWPFQLRRLFAEVQPDVVFCIHGGANVAAALAHILAGSQSRLVLSERSALLRDDRSVARNAIEMPAKRWLYRRADAITAVSDGVGRDLVARLSIPRTAVEVVYNPIIDDDLATLAAVPVPHPWFEAPTSTPILLAVGRLVSIKDYPTLIAAFARVREQRPARLVILGDGPMRFELEEMVRRRKLAPDVWFAGFDTNPFRYMARSSLLVHASRAEGLPGVLIQAMACSLPVVATDCDFGPRELITPGHDGFLVRVGDAEMLAAHAMRLLDDPALAARIGKIARESAQRFTTRVVLERYESVLLGTT